MFLHVVLLLVCVAVQAADVNKAHLVWMNHLDVGYTNTIPSVLNQYFHEVCIYCVGLRCGAGRGHKQSTSRMDESFGCGIHKLHSFCAKSILPRGLHIVGSLSFYEGMDFVCLCVCARARHDVILTHFALSPALIPVLP